MSNPKLRLVKSHSTSALVLLNPKVPIDSQAGQAGHKHVLVAGVHIRMDRYGRLNLNDLHAASGGARRHQPSNWLRIVQTQELVSALAKSSDMRIKPVVAGRGRNGGTFAARALAISYAAWIDAHFHLMVLQTYEAVASSVHAAGLTLQQRRILAERRETDSAEAASIGSRLMHERRRQKPALQAEIARLQTESQGLLFIGDVAYTPTPAVPAANDPARRCHLRRVA